MHSVAFLPILYDGIICDSAESASGSVRSYPTSSKKQAADWDKLEAEVKKEEKDEKKEGDDGLNQLVITSILSQLCFMNSR